MIKIAGTHKMYERNAMEGIDYIVSVNVAGSIVVDCDVVVCSVMVVDGAGVVVEESEVSIIAVTNPLDSIQQRLIPDLM